MQNRKKSKNEFSGNWKGHPKDLRDAGIFVTERNVRTEFRKNGLKSRNPKKTILVDKWHWYIGILE